LTTALVRDPASAMTARVERLIAWSVERRASSRRLSTWFAAAVVLATVALASITYSDLLVRVHEATEWLVQ
jgi:hypothetical protein